MKKTTIMGILVLFMVLAIPGASAHVTLYLSPQDSIVEEGYCHTTFVELRANITADENFYLGQIAIKYGGACANITNLEWGSAVNPWMSAWNPTGFGCTGYGLDGWKYDWIKPWFKEPQSNTDVLIANLTVHCNSTEYCETPLEFSCGRTCAKCPLEVLSYEEVNLYPDDVKLINGTFKCGEVGEPGIEVNKTVWDHNAGAWVDVISDAEICEIYTFRCEVHNNGDFELIDILVEDTMSDSLEYMNNATIDPDDVDGVDYTMLVWSFPGPLTPGGTFVIEFDAKSIACGNDSNHLEASAVCEEPEGVVADEDEAGVNVPDGTDCGTDFYDDPVGYCNGDEVWEHQLYHDFYCEAGNCTDHTSWVNDTLVANCSESDGWHNIGNTEWITDPANVCKEKEQKEEEYRDYTCSEGACEYTVTETRWTDTGAERNKQNGTVCGHGDWEADTTNPCQERRQIHKCDNGECTPCGEYEYRAKQIPDLVITEKTEEWVNGNTYTVTYTIANIGNASAIASTTSLYVDGVHVANNSVGALAAGENHTATFTDVRTMSDNNDTIVVCADNTNNVSECNEDNNCLENVLESQGMPDLVIREKYEEWVNQAEKTYNITYTVCNNGTAAAGKSNTTISIDNKEVMEDVVDALAVGQCYTNTVGPYTMTGNRDLIVVCANKKNEVEECDENNNCLRNEFEYQGPSYQPDLNVMTNVTFDEDCNIIVNYTVTNIGSSKAGESTTCLYVDSTKLQPPSDTALKCKPKPTQNQSCPELNISESYTGTFEPVKCHCGEILTVKVFADCEYEVEESNENNNCREERVQCPTCKKPDLTVKTNVTLDKNGKVIVNYIVTNIGDETAGNSTTCMSFEKAPSTPSNLAVQCEPEDPWQQSQPCPVLKPGASNEGKFDFKECPCGETLNVTVCADYKDAVKESNETNNCEVDRVQCPDCKKPDLVVTKDEAFGNKGKVFVRYTVTNVGKTTAGISTTSLLVNGEVMENHNCKKLEPGKSYTSKFQIVECPCGETLNVTVCADYKDAVKESNETNNCLEDEYECPPCGPTTGYGKKVHSQRNVLYARGALGEPDNSGALMYRHARIAIKLEDTIPNCEKVSVRVRRVAGQAPKFTVEVSSDGKSWTKIGKKTCTSFGWTLYDFNGNWDNVKYIRITKPGSSSRRWWQQLKLMGLDAVYAEGKPN